MGTNKAAWGVKLLLTTVWSHQVDCGSFCALLAIYSLIVGMSLSGQWENVATMLNIKLDFCCCDNSVGFCKSSHI